MKRAVFFDIDGTLLDSLGGITDITQKVKEVIRTLQERGDYVFIATGRPYAYLNKTILEFGFDGFILTNGAHVIVNNETIYNKPISKDFIKELVLNLDSNKVQYVLQSDLYVYMKEEHKELSDFYDKVGIGKKYFISEYNINEVDICKVEMLCPNKEIADYCSEFIKTYPEYDYFKSVSDIHLELCFKESTKAKGILKAIEHLNIPIENTYAFGDGMNDIEMLTTVGCGIAMGNASDEVKKYANEVTETIHNDGVAIGIERYILNCV